MARVHVGAARGNNAGGRKLVVHKGIEIAVFNLDGELHAYRNRCPYQLGPACEGPISGTILASADMAWRAAWTLEGRVLLCP